MKSFITFVVVAVAAQSGALSVSAADWGDLTGKFVLEGKAPTPKPLVITKDNQVCDQFKAEIVEQDLLVGDENGLSNVFVYIRVPSGKTIDVHADLQKAAEKPVVLENFHCMFYPHALGVWAKKQKLIVKNRDPLAQVVKIDLLSNSSVNVVMGLDGGEVEQVFQKAERVPANVSCGIHPWESARLLVLDHPYFAVTDKNGAFTIKNIPAGEWEIQVWQEKVGFLVAKPEWKSGRFKQTIKAGENALGTIKVPLSLFEKESKK